MIELSRIQETDKPGEQRMFTIINDKTFAEKENYNLYSKE